MAIEDLSSSFSGTDLTTRTEVLNRTVARDGWLSVGVEIPSGLDTSERTVFEADVEIDAGSGEKQAEHTSFNKRASGDTSIFRRALFTFPVQSGDVVKLNLLSNNANDTSISGSAKSWLADYADVEQWRESQPDALSTGAVNANLARVADNAVQHDGSGRAEIDLAKIAGSDTIDTVTLQSLFETLLNYIASPKTDLSENQDGTKTLSVKKQDGVTEQYAITFDAQGQWQSSTIN